MSITTNNLQDFLAISDMRGLNVRLKSLLLTKVGKEFLGECKRIKTLDLSQIINLKSDQEIENLALLISDQGIKFISKLHDLPDTLIKFENLGLLDTKFLKLLLNDRFDSLITQRLVTLEDLLAINNPYICILLITAEGIKALKNGIIVISDLIDIKDNCIHPKDIIDRMQELLSGKLIAAVDEKLLTKKEAFSLTKYQYEDLTKGSAYERLKKLQLTTEEFLDIASCSILATRLIDLGVITNDELAARDYICPITRQLINDPVTIIEHANSSTPKHYRFERYAIEKWIRDCESQHKAVTNPLTRQVIDNNDTKLLYDADFKEAIHSFLSSKEASYKAKSFNLLPVIRYHRK